MNILALLRSYLPLLSVLVLIFLAEWVVRQLLLRRERISGRRQQLPKQLIPLLLSVLGLILIVLAAPLGETTRNQLLSLLGVLLTGIIAFSSTSFVANAMAGLMLRTAARFRPGDFIRVDEQFGRVTERGLFHTEIQTENGDLTMLPNMYLANQPVTVVRESGPIVSANLSLGYDVPHQAVEKLLVKAAEQVGLHEGFVQVTELGNYAVEYRVAGFLEEGKPLLTTRSNLRKAILDTLHGAGIEIVSPSFMVQRPLAAGQRVRPPAKTAAQTEKSAPPPEELIFDKAERAGELEQLREEQSTATARLRELEKKLEGKAGREKEALQEELERQRVRIERLATQLAEADS